MSSTEQNPIVVDPKSIDQSTVVKFDDYSVAKRKDDLLCLAGRERLINEINQLLIESGYSEDFDAACWVDRWLHRPNHALGGAAPELFLHTRDGVQTLSLLIAAMAEGSYL
jgi:hypothetical protein